MPIDPPLGVVRSSERGFDGTWIHVRVDDVQLPSGRLATREVVEHPGAVAIVAITRGGEVLLLRQAHHPIQRVLARATRWHNGTRRESRCLRPPGIRPRRQGIAAGPVTQLASYYTSPGYTSEQLTIFLRGRLRGLAGGMIDPDELIRVVPTP